MIAERFQQIDEKATQVTLRLEYYLDNFLLSPSDFSISFWYSGSSRRHFSHSQKTEDSVEEVVQHIIVFNSLLKRVRLIGSAISGD